MKQISFLLLALMLSVGVVQAGFTPEFSVANADGILISYAKCENWPNQCEGNGLIVTWPETGAPYVDEVIIPSSVTYEGITYGVTGIGIGTFEDCTDLKGIGIPESVHNIDPFAFGDTELTDIYVSWSDPSIVTLSYGSTFSGITAANITLHVPIGATAAYESSDVWKEFKIAGDGKTAGDKNRFARLANLSVSYGTLSPAFSPTHYTYGFAVPQSVDRITLTATPMYGGTASGDGEKTLSIGENTLEITAIAVDGTLRTYTVSILRLEGEIVLNLTSALRQTGEDYFEDHQGFPLFIQDRTLLKYRLITGDISGNVQLTFAAGSRTSDRSIILLSNALYDMYLLLWIDKTDIRCQLYSDFYGQLSSELIYPNQTTETMTVSLGDFPLHVSSIDVLGPTERIEFCDLSLQGSMTPIDDVSYDGTNNSPIHAFADRLTLSGLQGNETLRIYSISGNLLLSDTATGETTVIDIAHLPAGIYLVGIQSDKGISTHKFIKQ